MIIPPPPTHLWLILDFSKMKVNYLKGAYQLIKRIPYNEYEINLLENRYFDLLIEEYPEYYDVLVKKKFPEKEEKEKKEEKEDSPPKIKRKKQITQKMNTPIKIPFIKKPKKNK